MGLELKNCRATINEVVSSGRLHVDSNVLAFRSGDVGWEVKIGKGTRVKVESGLLRVSRGSKSASFVIGVNAEKWSKKILNPPTRATKLGLKADLKYLIKGKFDEAFKRELKNHGLISVRMAKSCKVAFVLLDSTKDLKQLRTVINSCQLGTPIWAVFPKGIEAIRQADVIATAREYGMGPGKGIAFDDLYSAMRFAKK